MYARCGTGENEEVRKAVGRKAISGRGIRILCMDGGGMKVRSHLDTATVATILLDIKIHSDNQRLRYWPSHDNNNLLSSCSF